MYAGLALAFSLAGARAGTIAPDDPGLFYSPYGWRVTAASATTANSGSYLRCLFSGNAANLTFDVARMVSPPSQLYWRIDNSPFTRETLAAGVISMAVPPNNTHGDLPFHFLEVIVKSSTLGGNRWLAAGNSSRVVFTGLQLEAGAVVAEALPSPLSVLIFGDSITEGVITNGDWPLLPYPDAGDVNHHDATQCWSFRLGALLGAETGVVGFGGQGLVASGAGSVPPFPETFALLWEGVPRVFDPVPSLIVINQGTNDHWNPKLNITAQMTTALNGLLAAAPGAPIAVLEPFGGFEAASLRAAIAATSDPSACHYVDTTGFYNKTIGGGLYDQGLHPTGPNDLARIAPRVAAQLRPILFRSFLARNGETGVV